MARPRINIDKNIFEHLCSIFCTLEDIAGVFDCSTDTIERWCLRTYQESFADTYKKKSAKGRSSLRKYQFAMAKKNPTMAIWLGKQYLGQKDNVETAGVVITEETRNAIAGLLNAIDTGTGNKDSKD